MRPLAWFSLPSPARAAGLVAGLCLALAAAAWSPAAWAAPAGYYLPADVAEESELFKGASEEMAPRFQAASDRVAAAGVASEGLELGPALLGAAAPAGMAEWAADTRRSLVGQTLRMRRFLGKMQEDYSNVFLQAMKQALGVVGKDYALKQCGNTGVMAQFQQNNCAGENVNAKIAAVIDQDAALKAALTEIRALAWPDLVIEKKQWALAPLTGAERSVDVVALAKALLGERLKARQAALEEQAALLEEGIDARDPEAIRKAGELKEAWRRGLSEDGAIWQGILKEALARLEKKGGPAAVGLCGNPALTGGCAGEDVTAEVIALLKADKKYAKAAAGISGPL